MSTRRGLVSFGDTIIIGARQLNDLQGGVHLRVDGRAGSIFMVSLGRSSAHQEADFVSRKI